MSGLGDKLKGSVKEAAGNVTDDDKLKAQGKADQVVGNVKDKVDQTKGTAGEKVNETLDKAKDKTDDDTK